LRSLVYHETVPGHHFQIALEMENKDLPRFRQIRAFGGISALREGWGLYAERLAVESGWYENDPEGLLGQLDAELFRARRLVVDTGIHSKHCDRLWDRAQRGRALRCESRPGLRVHVGRTENHRIAGKSEEAVG